MINGCFYYLNYITCNFEMILIGYVNQSDKNYKDQLIFEKEKEKTHNFDEFVLISKKVW